MEIGEERAGSFEPGPGGGAAILADQAFERLAGVPQGHAGEAVAFWVRRCDFGVPRAGGGAATGGDEEALGGEVRGELAVGFERGEGVVAGAVEAQGPSGAVWRVCPEHDVFAFADGVGFGVGEAEGGKRGAGGGEVFRDLRHVRTRGRRHRGRRAHRRGGGRAAGGS